MLGHIGLNVVNLAAAQHYYDRLMPLLGFEPYFSTPDECSYRPSNGKPGTYLFLCPAGDDNVAYSRTNVGLQHLAFMMPTRTHVRRVHQFVLDQANDVIHTPRAFPEYPPPYFATFWLDPFGFMLEAVCHHDRE